MSEDTKSKMLGILVSLLSLQKVTLCLSGYRLLNQVDWHIQAQDRIALVGRNGQGKSSLLNLLQGQLVQESGQVLKVNGLRIAALLQEVPAFQTSTQTVSDVLTEAAQHLSSWDVPHTIESIATRLGLDITARMSQLSGGMIRRTLLAAALITAPDILLLDEPTNHLDIHSIEWLESYLKQYSGALIFVSHDRTFLDQVANQIVELDRGRLHTYHCDYETFLARREARLLSEQKQHDLFDKRLQTEEVWIRKGIEARRTRNEGRVRALKAMRETYRQRQSRQGDVKNMSLELRRSGKLVIEAKQVNYAIQQKNIIQDFSLLLSRGDKIGIIGPNGCGKTTLIRLLLQEIAPDSGEIRQGTSLAIAYFDQLRNQLNENVSIMANVADGADFVTINGKNKHVASYLQDFLFTPDRFQQPVSSLSGGERNRLLLAKLFAKPVNLLVMDEPTNDLDIETLELLESILVDYAGTLLLISHDRAFINDVVTHVLVYEKDGKFHEYVGGYDTYIEQKKTLSKKSTPPPQKQSRSENRKLSFKEQRELAELPKKIEDLEQALTSMQAEMTQKTFYQQPTEQISAFKKILEEKEQLLEELMTRWEVLEKIDAGAFE